MKVVFQQTSTLFDKYNVVQSDNTIKVVCGGISHGSNDNKGVRRCAGDQL